MTAPDDLPGDPKAAVGGHFTRRPRMWRQDAPARRPLTIAEQVLEIARQLEHAAAEPDAASRRFAISAAGRRLIALAEKVLP